MTIATTRVGPRFRVVIPKKIRDAAGIKEGDFIEAEVRPGGILLRLKALVDRDPEGGLAEALDDLEAGRFYGPYENPTQGLDEAVTRERERGLTNDVTPRRPRIRGRISR